MATKKAAAQKTETPSKYMLAAIEATTVLKLKPALPDPKTFKGTDAEIIAEFKALAEDKLVKASDKFSPETEAVLIETGVRKVKAAAPAEKKAAGKKAPAEKKAAGEKTARKPGVGALVKEMLLAGKDTEAILVAVKKHFPDAATTAGNVSWYKNDLRKKGELKK